MNEELQKQLANAVQKGLELAETTGEFVIDQAPDLIKQLIMYNAIESALLALSGIIFFIVGYKFVDSMVKKTSIFDDDEFDPFLLFHSIPILIGSLLFFDNFGTFLKCVIAPKIFLIEYFIK